MKNYNINGRLLARLERTRIMIKFASWFAFEWFNEYKFEMVDLFITSVVPRSCRLLNGRQLEKTPEDNNLIKGQVWTRGQKNLFLKFVVFFGNSCLKTFSFLTKKLRKNTVFFFLIHWNSVSNICFEWRDFPAKKLRKNTGAQNTHAPFFFWQNDKVSCIFNHIVIKYKSIKSTMLFAVSFWSLFSF